jgi:hypothetical protein
MAVTFNGTTSNLVWSGAIASAFPFSIFAWIKPGSAASAHFVAASGNNAGGDIELAAFADGANGVKAFSRAGGGSTNAANPAAIQTTWQPVLVCFDSTGQRRSFYAAGAVATDFTSSNGFASAHNRFAVGCRGISDSLFFAGDIAAVAVWQGGSQMTQGHFDSLAGGADPITVNAAQLVEYWRLVNAADLTGTGGRTLTATAVTTAGTDPFGSPSVLSGGGALDDLAAGGALSSGASDMSGGGVLADLLAAGSLGPNPGTCVIPALKNWSGSLQTAATVPWVTFCRLTDAVQVLILANQVTHASTADLSVTNAALAPGTWYMALGFSADGSQRFARPVLAA